ncbi:putative protein kinase domain-containing protein [Phytophthora infestans]|uniref:Protein kinase domain-containing protein n=1 Tax=Phytophthora infestans TaxID=4787 RepID=A0A833STD0_PHYIN|nr:putative protein kinase domain-containing protein [Phytophthora infestans]KAF4129903.1 putative protein kinase domain-containing protein [Phytophthora infestans]
MLMRFSRSTEPSPKRLKLTDMKEMLLSNTLVTWSCRTLYGNSFSSVSLVPKEDERKEECHQIVWEEGAPVIPVVLLNEVFARFDANCKSIELTSSDIPFVLELCSKLSTPFYSEDEFASKALSLLSKYLFPDVPIRSSLVSDGCSCYKSRLLINVKFQKGKGENLPTMHNIGCYIHALPDPVDCQVPSFLLDFSGTLLSVSGVVNVGADKLVCDPLSAGFPLFLFENDDLLLGLARMCASLKVAFKELSALISSNSETLKPPMDQLQFPYRRSYMNAGVITKFTYKKRILNLTFEAETESGIAIIVKFSRTYGKEVHIHCANAGVAPALLHCEVLVNGWRFIVMEKLNSVPLMDILQEKGIARKVLEPKIRRIGEVLQQKNFVHGDLRLSNLLWEEEQSELKIIDFDWAGKYGETVYPPFLNTGGLWSDGVGPGNAIQPAHDEYWIELLLELEEVFE